MRVEEKYRLCSLCGKQPALTRDHIPPKSIFPKPHPIDLITVPACLKCNKSTEEADEKFRVYLNFYVGKETKETEMLWNEHTLHTVRHNPRVAHDILDSIKPVFVASKGGIITGRAEGFAWPCKWHDPIIEKTIRGLYYHHYGDILGEKVTMHVKHLEFLPDELLKKSKAWPTVSIANGQFVYRYGRAEEKPLYSLWIFQFYRKKFAWGYTEPTINTLNLNIR